MKNIANQVIEARSMRQLTQDQLSELTGISKEILTELEAGQLDPNVTLLSTIAKKLNCTFQIGDFSI